MSIYLQVFKNKVREKKMIKLATRNYMHELLIICCHLINT